MNTVHARDVRAHLNGRKQLAGFTLGPALPGLRAAARLPHSAWRTVLIIAIPATVAASSIVMAASGQRAVPLAGVQHG